VRTHSPALAALIITAACLSYPVPARAADQPTSTEQQLTEAILSLHWLDGGKQKLPASNSTLALPGGYKAVLGEDARRFYLLMGNPSADGVEAVALSPSFEDEVVFLSATDGYVSVDDWGEVQPSSMLAWISENTEKENKERRRQGEEEIHVIGWLQEPTLDRQTNTVYWALEGTTPAGRIVNSIALRLGRKGYEELNWITERSNYVSVGGQLDIMLRAHSFDPGYRYSDRAPGDKTALYGIAGLVAAVAGAKAVKAAAGVGLAVLLKKFGVILFGALAMALLRFKNLFRRKPPSGTSSSHP
jgi:uncharacterized membrane-anchored protein